MYLQADANDIYILSGSDELNGTYRPLAPLPNVVAQGHGAYSLERRLRERRRLQRAAAEPRLRPRAALDVLTIQGRLERTPRVRESLREVGIQSAYDLLATYGVSARDMRAWIADAPVNRDLSLKLEYISGLAMGQQKADLIYSNMIAQRVVPKDLFSGPADALAMLKLRIEAMNKQ